MATTAGENTKVQGETVQQVEEELSIGKREVVTGGVRVTTSVSEQPVEQTVTLREEKVEAERKNVDRKLSPEEAEAAFQGRTVEAHEETIQDTVRRTEVEVEELGTEARKPD